jgi:hypothetical protein
MVKPSGILAILLLKRPKGVRHIPMRFENARTHAIKSLIIVSPQTLIIARCPMCGFAVRAVTRTARPKPARS